jgi:DNA mismatch repair protein MutS
MKQYGQVKAKHPDAILLFRMGDFFETFEEDARITARVLGITLTRRGNGAAGEVPLAGFPHHALDAYLPKLLKAGYRVAICEQLEDPKLAKGIVKRDVIEVVTPGVAFSDRVLDQKQNNYLAAIALPSVLARGDDLVGFAFVDISTADFRLGEFPLRRLREQVAALVPSELLLQKRDAEAVRSILGTTFAGLITRREDWLFNEQYGRDLLLDQFKTRSLKGFGLKDFTLGIAAAGAIMHYLQETQKANLSHLNKIVPFTLEDHITLDPSTKRNLEITSSLSGGAEGTLFSVLDHTRTPMGARLLKWWVHHPLKEVGQIRERLDSVETLVSRRDLRDRCGTVLSSIGDLERLNARICTGRASPRELAGLREVLPRIGELREAVSPVASGALLAVCNDLDPLPEAVAILESALESDVPQSLAEGSVIRRGYNAELDELRTLAQGGKQWIAALQQSERERTGISSLKVGFNSVFGYYIEITHAHREKVPHEYIRKQTLTNAERYITPQMKEQEEKILHAQERILSLESELFHQLRQELALRSAAIQTDAAAIARLDCLLALATAAEEFEYVRPEVNDGNCIDIRGGRHPVIERLLPPGERYVPNDLLLDTDGAQILIVTGPNMSGKSSYLRQAGLIVLLAQIGSYVPASAATIGIVDSIFTRVGASDNIASGESTFLVEMHEAAHIVNTATQRSLILLDEVGRGTSTFDGISIAWALTEYLHEKIGARTLFATHYHELNELAELFSRIRNVKVDVREYDDRVVFLHTVTPGSADHSYGIQVARMAGLPAELTERATTILHRLEATDLTVQGPGQRAPGRLHGSGMQLTLFEPTDDALREKIALLKLESMTPLEAFTTLAELQKELRSKEESPP